MPITNHKIKNILVGVGKVEVSPTAGTAFDSSTFTDVGFTVNGLDVSWEPDIVDIMVDQLGDAAKLVENKTKLVIKTTLAEATLDNLAIAWGYPDGNVTGTTTKVFSLGVFATGIVTERSFRFTGKSPDGHDRVYVCRRVCSVSTSAHSYKRAEATLYPVEFRVLPDATQTGSEYGIITDTMDA